MIQPRPHFDLFIAYHGVENRLNARHFASPRHVNLHKKAVSNFSNCASDVRQAKGAGSTGN